MDDSYPFLLTELQPKAGHCPRHKEIESQEDVKDLSSWSRLSSRGGEGYGWGEGGLGQKQYTSNETLDDSMWR